MRKQPASEILFLVSNMPPKQRAASSGSVRKTHSKTKSTSNRTNEEELPSSEHAQVTTEERRRKKVKWSPVFKRLGYVFLIFLIPSILNYAALNQESRMLVPEGINECILYAVYSCWLINDVTCDNLICMVWFTLHATCRWHTV